MLLESRSPTGLPEQLGSEFCGNRETRGHSWEVGQGSNGVLYSSSRLRELRLMFRCIRQFYLICNFPHTIAKYWARVGDLLLNIRGPPELSRLLVGTLESRPARNILIIYMRGRLDIDNGDAKKFWLQIFFARETLIIETRIRVISRVRWYALKILPSNDGLCDSVW